jgi:hypothetical protein
VARSATAKLVLRLVLIANTVLLVALGTLFVVFVERPAGLVVGGILWLVSAGLVACLPLTDPYRHERGGR